MLKLFFITLFFVSTYSSTLHADSIPAVLSDSEIIGTCKVKILFNGQNIGTKNNSNISDCTAFANTKAGPYISAFGYGLLPVVFFESYPLSSSSYRSTLEVTNASYATGGKDISYTLTGLKYSSVEVYTCPNSSYPILNGQSCSSSFAIDDDSIASLNFKVESSQALVDEMIQKNNELGDFIESTENAFDSALDSTASGMATINAMEKQVDTALEFKELNPNSDLIRSFADDMEANLFTAKELSNQNLVEVEGIVEIQDNANTIFNDNNQIIGFAQNGIQYIYGASEEILLRVDNQTDYDEQINIVDSNYDSILTNSNTLKNNSNSLDTSTNANGQTEPQVKSSNITNNNSSIQNIVNNNNSTFNSISNAAENGEVCSGSKCVPVPDVEESDDENNTARVTAPTVSEGFYETKYPDGFSGLLDKSVSGFKSGPFYAGMNQFAFNVGGGALPSWDLCFNTGILNLGCHDLTVPLYVWHFIKACLLICTVFLCRAIVFGG